MTATIPVKAGWASKIIDSKSWNFFQGLCLGWFGAAGLQDGVVRDRMFIGGLAMFILMGLVEAIHRSRTSAAEAENSVRSAPL